jgi:ADP-ribosylglycohydrolase
MLEKYRGCLVGAAIGDALGMPGETGPSMLGNMQYGYRRAWRAHPNAGLIPGQFTDDTQMMLLVAELFANNTYSDELYARELEKFFEAGKLRFPDGSVKAACEHMQTRGLKESGVASTTAGCLPLALPFALVFDDFVELREGLVQACSITHTHPAVHAAAIAFAMLIRSAISGSHDPVTLAYKNAILEDETLGARIRAALNLEKEGISLDSALSVIGNDVSVFQTLPISFFLIERYPDPEVLLTMAANIGGNTSTIGFICGAYAGVSYGLRGFLEELAIGLEGKDRIETIAVRLHDAFGRKD